MKIPIFPLPVYLLPGGVTRLRIFEQRYLSMIKNANKTNGFVISYYQKNQISKWGSWVDLINFEMGDDNVLVIDVKCKKLVKISSSEYQNNGLLWGDVLPLNHWTEKPTEIVEHELSVALQKVFEHNHDLSQVYQGEFQDNLAWVCARWIELLPLTFSVKQAFVETDSFEQVIGFLNRLLKEQDVCFPEPLEH